MWTYPYHPYLESLLIALAVAIGAGVPAALIAWVLRPKAGVEG